MNSKLEYNPTTTFSVGVEHNEAGDPLFVHGTTVVGTVDDIRALVERYDEQQGRRPHITVTLDASVSAAIAEQLDQWARFKLPQLINDPLTRG